MKKNNLFIISILIAFYTNVFAQNGEEIFKSNCTRCHTIGNGQLVGPDLRGSMTKYSEEWLVKWIRSSQTLIKEGDVRAKELFKKFNEMPMADNDLSDEKIKSVIAYVNSESGQPMQATASASGDIDVNNIYTQMTKDSKSEASLLPVNSRTIFSLTKTDSSVLIMGIAAIVIVISFIVLSRTIFILTKVLHEKNVRSELIEKKMSIKEAA